MFETFASAADAMYKRPVQTDNEATVAATPRPKSDRGFQFKKALKFHGRSAANDVPHPTHTGVCGSLSRPQ
jgi:hypothetical protein